MTTPEDPNPQGPWEGNGKDDVPPQSSNPPPDYFAPPPAYGTPPPAYGTPPSRFGTPPPQFGAPPPQYGQPQYGVPAWAGAPLASWLQRVGATLVDGIITTIPIIILVALGAAIGGGGGAAIIVIAYLAAIGFGIWNQVFRQGTTGQTIGKSVLNIKVVREQDGQVLGPGPCFIRQLAHIVDGIACDIGYLWPLWDDKNQTFADKLCNTVVITVPA